MPWLESDAGDGATAFPHVSRWRDRRIVPTGRSRVNKRSGIQHWTPGFRLEMPWPS